MKKKFFKNLFEKDNNLQMYSINEFNVFRDIISFSKVEVYKEMKSILNNIDKKIDREMAETVEKYHIVMGLKSQTEDISAHLNGEEEIDVVISDSKEASIIAKYSEKMLHKLLEVGFASTDLELERKAMTVTYSKRIMMKLNNIAKKDPSFLDENCNYDMEECMENAEFKDLEEVDESKFERFRDINETEEEKIEEELQIEETHIEKTNIEEINMEEIQEDLEEIIDDIERSCHAESKGTDLNDNRDSSNDVDFSNNYMNDNNYINDDNNNYGADNADNSEDVDFSGNLKINIYGEDEDFASDKNNTSGVDEGGIDMIDEKYSKEAYDLFVKGDDKEVAEENKKLGEEEYDVIIRESTDMVLRDNKDKEKVGEEAYEELIKGRKIKEVEESEY